MRKTLLLLSLLVLSATPSFAQSILDTSFGAAGRFTYHFSTSTFARLSTTKRLPDGKILGAGETVVNSSSRAAVVRCDANGILDTSFGVGGEWISDDPNFIIASQLIIQPDGKILLSGYSYQTFKVVRLLPEGTYDPDFGQGGKSEFSVWSGTTLAVVYDMALQADGKIVGIGETSSNDAEAMIAQLKADGTLDDTFGTFGKVILKPALFNANTIFASRVGVNPEGQILISGYYRILGQPNVGYVMRYQSTGQRDLSFGNNGAALIQNKGPISDIFILPSNNISVLCGIYDTISFKQTTTLIQWTADGNLDTSFANHGYAAFPITSDQNTPRNGFLQSDGKIMVFGNQSPGLGFLGRFNTDGTIDSTLGINGLIISNEYYADGFVQPDGKIVVAGPYVFGGPMEEASILRYLGPNSVGVIETPSPISSALLYPNPVSDQSLSLAYELPDASPVRIDLLDLQGKILGTLLNADRAAGKNEETISLPADLGNGLYFLNIQTNKGNAVIKLSVLRV